MVVDQCVDVVVGDCVNVIVVVVVVIVWFVEWDEFFVVY